jgi:hypothetical protein
MPHHTTCEYFLRYVQTNPIGSQYVCCSRTATVYIDRPHLPDRPMHVCRAHVRPAQTEVWQAARRAFMEYA